jgi:hypothetical protein
VVDALESGQLGEFAVVRERHLLLQHWIDGWWSAFTGQTSKRAMSVDCLRILPRIEISIAGVAYDGDGPLYRGEGRASEFPYADCADLNAMIERVFSEGFRARVDGTFSGTLLDQIRQQGYVPNPTLSLTSSFDAAVVYATARGTEKQRDRGAVFSINPKRLRELGTVWSSFASMQHGTQVFLSAEPDAIVHLVQSCANLQAAGQLLERISHAVTRRASEFQRSPTFQPSIRNYMDGEDWSFGEKAIGSEPFEALCSAFEFLAPIQLASPTEQVVARGAYGFAFAHALPELTCTLKGSTGVHRNPGWDTTIFGYIAKTCRDQEFFSSGSIPPEAITDAVIVAPNATVIEKVNRRQWSVA